MTGPRSGTGHKPRYALLKDGYPTANAVKLPELYDELGIGALTNNAAYQNTCAIRMSYALAKAGLILKKGGLRINIGPHKGKRLEPSMKKLAEQLADMWGPPEKYGSTASANQALHLRKGVVAFFFGDFLPLVNAQGHIALLDPKPSGYLQCVGSCFFDNDNKVWFWPLD